jgi:hypothetical protein
MIRDHNHSLRSAVIATLITITYVAESEMGIIMFDILMFTVYRISLCITRRTLYHQEF